MNNNNKNDNPDHLLLEEYSKEMNLGDHYDLTLLKLIKSHRYLRSLNLESNDVYQDAYKKGFEQGHKQGVLRATTLEYISMKELRGMTIQDLCELIQESSEKHE